QLRGVRVEVPAAEAGALAGLELVIGTRVIESGPLFPGWGAHDGGAFRVFTTGPSLSAPRSRMSHVREAMNWSGDRHFAAVLAGATACALAALAALAGLMTIAGRLVVA